MVLMTLALVGVPRTTRANGRFPASGQITVAPADPNFLVSRATFGILVSADRGRTWDWLCETAVGYGGVQDPTVGIAGDRSLIVGFLDGLTVSRDGGCSWTRADGTFKGQAVVDLVVRPDDPKTVLAVTSTYSGQNDAGEFSFRSQVHVSRDHGATWNVLGTPLDPSIIVQTIEVSPSDPARIYISGTRGLGTRRAGLLLVSRDNAAIWEEHPILLEGVEEAPFLAAVDRANADRIYVRTNGTGANRLLVSEDAGRTFRQRFATRGIMAGFALSPDNRKVFVGGPSDGLHVASTEDLEFTRTSDIQVQCLFRDNTTLWACSNDTSGFVVGSSEDDGKTFTPKLQFKALRGPLSCGSKSSASVCTGEWPAVRERLGIESFPDSGSDAGAGGGAGEEGGCGCTLGNQTSGMTGTIVSLSTIALLWRRQRTRSQRRSLDHSSRAR